MTEENDELIEATQNWVLEALGIIAPDPDELSRTCYFIRHGELHPEIVTVDRFLRDPRRLTQRVDDMKARHAGIVENHTDVIQGGSALLSQSMGVDNPAHLPPQRPASRSGSGRLSYADDSPIWQPHNTFGHSMTQSNAPSRHPGTQHLLNQFAYGHLPTYLQRVSKPIGDLANNLAGVLRDGPELSAGLRKLLEAKDCLVRQAVEDKQRSDEAAEIG